VALHVLGGTVLLQGDREGAAALFQESLAVWRECGVAVGPAYDLMGLAGLDLAEGRIEQAYVGYQEALSVFASRQERRGAATCLVELALLAAEWKESLRAARLFAVSEAQRESVGLPLDFRDPAVYESGLQAVRVDLGEEVFAAAWAQGRAMTLEQAVACAREEDVDNPQD
jgi:hypothetical protein